MSISCHVLFTHEEMPGEVPWMVSKNQNQMQIRLSRMGHDDERPGDPSGDSNLA